MGVQQQVLSLEEALLRTRRGNLIYGEIVARRMLEQEPDNVPARQLLGLVALSAGLIGPAAAIFQEADRLAPGCGFDQMAAKAESLIPAWRARRAARDPAERFLLVKAWGYGFGSDLGSLMGTLLLADLTRRTPVIHWGPNSLYSDGMPGDAFRNYFVPPNALTLADLAPRAVGAFPAKWTPETLGREDFQKFDGPGSRLGGLYFLERDEPLAVFDYHCNIVDLKPWIPADHPYAGMSVPQIYRALWSRWFRPTEAVTARVERFAATHWPRGRVVAVHLRDGDHRYEQRDLLSVNDQYFALIDRLLAEAPASLYLMTDSEGAVAAFRQRYGERVFTTESQRTPDDTGIHYRPGTDRIRLGIDVLSDILLATRAGAFIGNGRSNPSCTVYQLKEWPPGTAHMIVPSFHEERNLFLYNV